MTVWVEGMSKGYKNSNCKVREIIYLVTANIVCSIVIPHSSPQVFSVLQFMSLFFFSFVLRKEMLFPCMCL